MRFKIGLLAALNIPGWDWTEKKMIIWEKDTCVISAASFFWFQFALINDLQNRFSSVFALSSLKSYLC